MAALCVPPKKLPSATDPLPSHPCQPLTVAVRLPSPAARWRWQLKISSARLKYCVIFLFTASRRSLFGSTTVSTERA